MQYLQSIALTLFSITLVHQSGLAQTGTAWSHGSDAAVVSARAPLTPLDEAELIGTDVERDANLQATAPRIFHDESGAHLYTGPGTVDRVRILRGEHFARALLVVKGLDAGVYVMHWVVRANHHMSSESTTWATAAVVREDGVALFHARRAIDLTDVEVGIDVARCGPASDDIEVLSRQLLGIDCDEDALAHRRQDQR